MGSLDSRLHPTDGAWIPVSPQSGNVSKQHLYTCVEKAGCSMTSPQLKRDTSKQQKKRTKISLPDWNRVCLRTSSGAQPTGFSVKETSAWCDRSSCWDAQQRFSLPDWAFLKLQFVSLRHGCFIRAGLSMHTSANAAPISFVAKPVNMDACLLCQT